MLCYTYLLLRIVNECLLQKHKYYSIILNDCIRKNLLYAIKNTLEISD